MRGAPPRHCEPVSQPPAAAAGGREHGWTVISDLGPDTPVTDEELAVIEAFLMEQVKAVMAGEYKANNDNTAAPDSVSPQSHARMEHSAKRRGKGR